MFANALMSELMAIKATLSPQSLSAGSATTTWVPAGEVHRHLFLLQTGTLGANATVDARVLQATDAAGTGAKVVPNKIITQIVKASGDDKQALINVRPAELDAANGFGFIALRVTVGTAASLVSAVHLAGAPRHTPVSAIQQAAVVETIA